MNVEGVTLRRIDVGEVVLGCACAGDERAPLVVLLHGFPWSWFSWKKQIGALVQAGFRVAAPDMRGYGLSGKPRGARAYRIERLTEDVAALIAALGAERADVVGHDWGAIVAWCFAMSHAHRLRRLAILNVPHPARFRDALRLPEQIAKSWYIGVFQIPWVAERVFMRDGFRALWRLFPIDGATEREIEEYLAPAQQPGALTAMINYYRAARGLFAGRIPLLRPIEAPVLVLWGDRDHCLSSALAEPPRVWVPSARLVRFPSATHWVHVDEASRVNAELVAFLGPSAS
jgi:pimeloyl-ACP methyl ester carboxylesterase